MSDAGHTERLEAALALKYRIERKLGEGGMAWVYLADDLKHGRKVALKILRPELAAVLGAERFLSEIKTTAGLQHPHILPLFDSGEAEGYLYYVMPYIGGETLRQKLDREKQLGVRDAVRIAKDVADALDYAHRHGVIHRDIKPGNILLHEGRPVVADFGIALAVSAAGGGRMTETGLSLGTPHYMSPEQASADRDLTARSDVYSLGCVLYEMLAGQPPHTGPSAQSILVHILTEEPRPLTDLRHTVPPNVAATVAKSIEKLPADRFESGGELRDALEDPGFTHQVRPAARAPAREVAGAAPVRPGSSAWLRDRRSIVTLALILAFASLAVLGWLRSIPEPPAGVPTRTLVPGVGPMNGVAGRRIAISRDGRRIVAQFWEDGAQYLFVRSADDPVWRRLANTEGATSPSFSPDGQAVTFMRSTGGFRVLTVPISGGPAVSIADEGYSPHWAFDDMIYYAGPGPGRSLYRVASSGGDPEPLTPDTLEVASPYLLPGGRAVLFGAGSFAQSRIVLLELETGAVRELLPSGLQPRYVPTGHLVYAVNGQPDGALMGVPFDLETLRVAGSPVVLLPQLAVRDNGTAQFAISETGTLIYAPRQDASCGSCTLVEVTLDGVETPLPGVGLGQRDTPRYSPDGTRIAYVDRSTSEIRVYDVTTGGTTTFESGGYPVWSTSGAYLYFSYPFNAGPGVQDGYRRLSDASEPKEQLWDRTGGNFVVDVSDGDSIVVVRDDGFPGSRNILLWRQGADSAEFEDFLTEEWNELNAEISPGGRWIAYQSDETGEYRVYVQSFPVKTGRRDVSPELGADPLWSPDSERLYYRSGGRVMSVDVETEPDFRRTSAPVELFDRPEYTEYQNPGPSRTWDIHPDGDRFVVVKTEADSGAGPEVWLVTNWFSELRERMGEN